MSKKILKFSKNKNRTIIKFVFIFCLSFLIIINSFNFLLIKINKNNIIESNNYQDFDKIKNIYAKNPFFRKFLEQITILSHIYLNRKMNRKKFIHISMSLNNIYYYIVLVSMESILFNFNNNETFIIFHILCTPDVEEKSINKIKSLVYHYAPNFKIIFYSMGNIFMEYKNIRFSQAAYYRLILPIIINSDRIIYLDGDTLTLQDITEMYYSDFDNNYVLGVLGIASWGLDYLGIKANNWINDGVLLLNLKKIRDENKCFDLLNINRIGKNLKHDDNTVVNYALYPYIGKLPVKYGIWNFFDKEDIEKYSNFLRQKINISEMEEARKDPGVVHNVLCNPKPWHFGSNYISSVTTCQKRNNCSCIRFHNLWHFYAKKTDYYKEILNNLKKRNHKK